MFSQTVKGHSIVLIILKKKCLFESEFDKNLLPSCASARWISFSLGPINILRTFHIHNQREKWAVSNLSNLGLVSLLGKARLHNNDLTSFMSIIEFRRNNQIPANGSWPGLALDQCVELDAAGLLLFDLVNIPRTSTLLNGCEYE